ncbi:MAG TPA: hypothetical protein VHH15_01385 [Actinophytocola sp.]|nr:hypothetical protein [Actinophytocola sp.]
MDCEEYREALSARLDDEEGPEVAEQSTDLHLDFCADCARWYENAALITRRTRTTAAATWPDVSAAVLSRLPPARHPGAGRRVALAAVGALLGTSALVSLTAQGGGHAAAAYETGAWHLALGVAFGVVAARRAAPGALIPLLGTFVAVLSWGHVADLLSGRWSLAGALPHLLAATGLVLVVLLGGTRPARRWPAPPATTAGRIRDTPEPDISANGPQSAIRFTKPARSA